jgi:cyclic pyranopterin phosphate synthase
MTRGIPSKKTVSAKRSLALRLSVTDRCPLRCVFCTPPEGLARLAPQDVLRDEEIVRFVRLMQSHYRLKKVHITGGEPLGRRGIVRLVSRIAAVGIADLALTTSGQRLAGLAGDLKQAGLARVNVTLSTLDPRTFRKLALGGSLAKSLAGIDAALAAGLSPVKCNAVVLRGINEDEVADLAQFAIDRGITIRFIELMPIGPAAARHRDWFVPAAEVLSRLRDRFTLRPLARRRGSSTREFLATDPRGRSGTVGIIASFTRPFCADCNRLRLRANGELVGCLARNSRASIRPLLRTADPPDEAAILAAVQSVLRQKRGGRAFAGDHFMVRTGG